MAGESSTPSKMSQNLEITLLKEKYDKECKVITDVGDFRHVVIMRPAHIDVVIKFQLSADYPEERPQVITRSETIAVDCLPEVDELVDSITTKNSGYPVIDSITQQILSLLQDKGLDTPPDTMTHAKKGKKKKNKPQQKKKENKDNNDTIDEKKSSMKTADDVIHRIQWDENLPTEKFTVGYLDRFTGIQEREFSDFSWEDLASADYDVLAIPQHRIQYFKYEDVIVWDKVKRIDNMFGSTGSGISISDVMENYDHFCTEENKTAQPHSEKSSENVLEMRNRDECDSDDDVQVDFGVQPDYVDIQPATWRADEDDVWEVKKTRPTHFLCVRITDENIRKNILMVQDAIVEKETRYVSCCPPIETLHVTLCTLGLDNPEQVQVACCAMEKVKTKLADIIRTPISLNIEGIDNFHNNVIYAKVRQDEEFMSMAQEIRVILKDSGVEIRDGFSYQPHLTIMKVSREVAAQMKTKRVRKQIYSSFEHTCFGEQSVDSISLCEMMNQNMKNGFYHTPKTIDLNQKL